MLYPLISPEMQEEIARISYLDHGLAAGRGLFLGVRGASLEVMDVLV